MDQRLLEIMWAEGYSIDEVYNAQRMSGHPDVKREKVEEFFEEQRKIRQNVINLEQARMRPRSTYWRKGGKR